MKRFFFLTIAILISAFAVSACDPVTGQFRPAALFDGSMTDQRRAALSAAAEVAIAEYRNAGVDIVLSPISRATLAAACAAGPLVSVQISDPVAWGDFCAKVLDIAAENLPPGADTS